MDNQLNIELSEDLAEGVYANLAVISHSPSEFILDFIRIVPNMPKAKVKSRVLMTPDHAKRLMRALTDNIRRYEQQFGVIEEHDNNGGGGYPPMNITPTAQA